MKIKLTLAACVALLTWNSHAQVLISGNVGNSYSQNFDSLLNTGTSNPWEDNVTIPGWYASKVQPGAVTTYRADNGGANSGAIYSYGESASTDRALGSLSSGTPNTLAYGVRFRNDTSDTVNSIVISYTGEQWRTANSTAQSLYFYYRTSITAITNSDASTNETWTAFPSLDFVTPTFGGTAGPLNGNDATNRVVFANVSLDGVSVGPGEELFLRWVDLNDPGSDPGVAVDDLTVSYSRTFVPPSGPSIVTEPQDTTANARTPASLSVVASGAPPLFYTWYKDNSPVVEDGNVSGTTNSSLDFASVTHSNAGVYKVVISNAINSVTSAPATLSVIGFAIAPVAATNTLTGTPVTVPINFLETENPITEFTVTSGNQTLLPDGNISVSGSGGSRDVTFTPVADVNGVAVITVTATDGSFSTNTVFTLMVRPNTGVLLNDYFDYADGSLIANSGFLWQNHGGTVGDLQVVSGLIYLSRSASEDVNAPLIGQPYMTNSGGTLYSKFTVNFNASDTPTSFGTYFAHFKDDEFGYRGRVWVSTNSAGAIRLGIGNGSDSDKSSGEFPLDIVPGTTYTVVTRLVLADDTSTIWINPTSESDTSVTATDAVTNGFINVASYAFRQSSGMSKLFVDDLVVGTSFAAVTGGEVTPTPIPLNVQRDGNNIVLTWSDPAFALQAAPQVSGTYTNIAGATSPYTNSLGETQLFFRLKN